MTFKETDLSWAAGFFDGEGCISFAKRIRNKNPEYELTLTIGQANISPLRKFQKLFGGRLRKDNLGYFRWYSNSKETLKILKLIKPYMFLKKKEAQIALLYEHLYTGKGSKASLEDLEKKDRLYRLIKREKLKYKKQNIRL